MTVPISDGNFRGMGDDSRRDLTFGGPRALARTDYAQDAAWDFRAGDDPEDRSNIDVLGYLRILREHWRVVTAVFAISLAIGVVTTLLTRPIYIAATTLQIDREAARVVNVEGVEPKDTLTAGDEFYLTQYGLLKSISLATRVVDKLGLASDSRFLTLMGIKPKQGMTPGAMRDDAIRVVTTNIIVTPLRGSRLVKVSFASPDPGTAARIANAVAENFIESNLDRRFEASSYARDFLQQRLAQEKQKLEDTERQLVAYATAQGIIDVSDQGQDKGDGKGASPPQSLTSASLVSLNTALSAAQNQQIQAEERWRQAQSGNGTNLPEVLANPTYQQLTQQRAKLAADYQQNLGLYKPDYPAMTQMKAQLDEIDNQIRGTVKSIRDSIHEQATVAASQQASLQGQVAKLKSSFMDQRNRSIQYNILQRELDTSRSLYDGLLQRYKEVGIAGGVGTNNVSVVDRAQAPSKPSSPNIALNVGLAAGAGLALGGLLAFLIEAMDQSVNTPEDVENKIGVSLLGSIPIVKKDVAPLDALRDIRSPLSEAYYSVRMALQFSTSNGVPRSLLITSARPAEGKSTTALAVAQNFARLGMRVVMIDADLRNPSLHKRLSLENSFGLTNVLTNSASIDEVLQPTELPNLAFMACGPLPPSPAELLAGPRLGVFMRELLEQFDLVVVDGPPVMGLADAPLLASIMAGTLMVVEASSTRRGMVKAALRRLEIGQAKIIGVLLTKFNARKAAVYGGGYGYSYSYDYSYGYGYGNDKALAAGDD
jgi:capsular exopolysaccharide synthesis family protein